MALVPLRDLLDLAAADGYGVAAFNVNNMEQIQAIMEAADDTDSPVIVQASRGARKYSQDAYLRHLMLAAVELFPHIPVVMHQDHGNSVETCMSAIENEPGTPIAPNENRRLENRWARCIPVEDRSSNPQDRGHGSAKN